MMEGDAVGDVGGETGSCFSTELDICSVKAKKHVAVIESSGSEDEDKAALSELQPPPGLALGDFGIRKSRSTVVPDSDNDSSGREDLGRVKPALETPKFVHQLDWNAWRKRKEEERLQKKLQKQLQTEEKAKILSDQCEYAKHMAWVNWVCKKKNDELQKKVNEIESHRLHEIYKTEKEKVAREKFEEWYKKKQQHDLLKKQSKNADADTAKGSKKNLTRSMKWEAWYEKKKTQTIPKRFTHVDYPKPSWVNPVPWHSTTSGDDSD